MKRVCVFCGSSIGEGEIYSRMANEMADALVNRSLELVYGAGNIGLMGILADRVLARGGKVTGVIPDFLVKKEVVHRGLSELHIVQTMHERKVRMAGLGDAFIAMPGGFGTLEEIFEVLTWNQLGMMTKPAGFLNVDGFFDPLIEMLDKMTSLRFLRKEHRDSVLVETDPEKLLGSLQQYRFPAIDGKWIDDLKASSKY